MPLSEAGIERILVMDAGGLDAMQEEIHSGDAEHGLVEVETLQESALDVVAIGLEEIAGEMPLQLTILVADFLDELRSGKFLDEILDNGHEEAGSPSSGIAAAVGGLRIPCSVNA